MAKEVPTHGQGKRQRSEGRQEGRPEGVVEGRRPVERQLATHELQRHFPGSPELCAYVARVSGDSCILNFSAGKDAVASWIQLRRYFKRIIPFYRWLVPDLEFVEDGLRYYEDFFKTEILRLPHPGFWRMLRNLVFQPPERCAIIENANLPDWNYDQINSYVKRVSDAPAAFSAIGVRVADSPVRRMNVQTHGSLTPSRRTFLPIYDWRLDDVVRELKAINCKLTVDYQMFGRSFDGIDHRFLAPIKERFPRDYKRILDWFPLAELEIFRREMTRA